MQSRRDILLTNLFENEREVAKLHFNLSDAINQLAKIVDSSCLEPENKALVEHHLVKTKEILRDKFLLQQQIEAGILLLKEENKDPNSECLKQFDDVLAAECYKAKLDDYANKNNRANDKWANLDEKIDMYSAKHQKYQDSIEALKSVVLDKKTKEKDITDYGIIIVGSSVFWFFSFKVCNALWLAFWVDIKCLLLLLFI